MQHERVKKNPLSIFWEMSSNVKFICNTIAHLKQRNVAVEETASSPIK